MHELALTFGGAPGIVNRNSILSAIGRPYSGYFRSIHRKAAALLHSMVKNHGFIDGNKRTTLLIVTLFLSRSGYGLGDVDEQLNEDFQQLIVDVSSNERQFDDCVSWFKQRLRKLDA